MLNDQQQSSTANTRSNTRAGLQFHVRILHPQIPNLQFMNRLVGLVVKASASKAEDLESEFRLRRDFSGSSHTNDLKNGAPVAVLPGAWCYRVSAGSGRPSVSIL